MVRNFGALSCCFDISYVFFSSGVKRSASFTATVAVEWSSADFFL